MSGMQVMEGLIFCPARLCGSMGLWLLVCKELFASCALMEYMKREHRGLYTQVLLVLIRSMQGIGGMPAGAHKRAKELCSQVALDVTGWLLPLRRRACNAPASIRTGQ